MRKNNMINTLGSAMLVAPLLVACGSEGSGSGTGTSSGQVPTCSAGQALSTNSAGELICVPLPSDVATLPTCDPTTEALTSNGQAASCTNRNDASDPNEAQYTNRVNRAEQQLNDFGTRLDKISNRPGAQRYYVGNTDQAVKGDIKTATNKDNGLAGAAFLCEQKFGAGARMCTPYDIYASVVAGKITSGMNIAKAWVYMPVWSSPLGTNTDGTSGLGDNCGSYTYETAHLQWSGIAVSTGVLNTTRWGVRFHGGSAALCNTALPIACCK